MEKVIEDILNYISEKIKGLNDVQYVEVLEQVVADIDVRLEVKHQEMN